MKSTITLGDMQDKGMRMLAVACCRCDRRGGLSITRLIAEHGRDDGGRLAQLIAHDCPKMQNPTADIYDRCGVHFPELPRWF
jgi:hypothetical protein